jgi:hypothetical protein
MSITVIGAFSRMGIQSPNVKTPIVPHIQSIQEAAPNIPQLPGDVLHKIFRHIQEDASNASLFPVLQTNSFFYDLAIPLVYNTIYLNRSTIRGLMNGTGIYCQKGRKSQALSTATRLVINDILVLFDYDYGPALRSFLNVVVLPNVTQVIFRQDRLKDQRMNNNRALFVHEDFQVSRPKMFAQMLPKVQDVCIQLSPNEHFRQMTTPRIMEIVKALSVKKDIRIHQSVNSRRLTPSME